MITKIKINKLAACVIACSATFSTSSALAELYVSPVIRDSVTYNSQVSTSDAERMGSANLYAPVNHHQTNGDVVHSNPAAHQQRIIYVHQQQPELNTHHKAPMIISQPSFKMPERDFISGTSKYHGDFVIRNKSGNTMQFGHNVPLFIALENLIPDSDRWMIKIDENLENQPISWEGGNTWQGSLKAIEQDNGLSIAINNNELAIGVAKTKDSAIALASRENMLWKLDKNKTLRENIENWAESSEWTLHWDNDVSSVNYPVIANASLKGKLHGKGGVLDRILNSTKEAPLAADFYYKNKVIHIRSAGYEHEVSF